MSEISRLVRFLIKSGYHWLAFILVLALALWLLLPIHLDISLGDQGARHYERVR